jgi:hypothetical protein
MFPGPSCPENGRIELASYAVYDPHQGTMSEDADSIRERMQNVRRSVGDDVEGIVHTAKALSDWRYYVKNHPWACLGAAFAAGFMLMPKRKLPKGDDARQLIELLRANKISLGAMGATPFGPGTGGLAKTLLAVAAPAVTRAVMTYVGERFAAGGQPPQAPPPEAPVREDL